MRARTRAAGVTAGAAEVAARLVALGSATVGEAGGTAVPPGLFPAWPGARCAGPARTVRCAPGDNLAVHAAVPTARPGEVLVVVTDGDPERGYWGEVLTTAAQASGVVGLLLDAGVRDVDAITARGFPVHAAVTALPGAGKAGAGVVGGPISLRGAAVEPGDWVVADADGVAVIAAGDLETVLAASTARAEKEDALMRDLAAGATTIELLGLDVSAVDVRPG